MGQLQLHALAANRRQAPVRAFEAHGHQIGVHQQQRALLLANGQLLAERPSPNDTE
jgi:hypothetical protein